MANMNSISTTNSISNGQQQEITGAPLDAPADCTIACDEGHITAHKLVLCVHSKYLQDILSKYPTAEHPIIILTELNIMDIKILVNYMYTGELVITNDSSPSTLLRAAQILKIDSLTAEPDDDQLDTTNNSNQFHDDDQLEDELDQNSDQFNEDDEELDYDDQLNASNNQQQHQHQQLLQQHQDELMLADDEQDDEDEDEDALDTIATLANRNANNLNSSKNSRLINSIKNIYSLIESKTQLKSPQNQQLFSASSIHGSGSTTTSSSSTSSGLSLNNNNIINSQQLQQLQQQHQRELLKLEFGSNQKHNNNTPNSISHLDLQDLQDSKSLDSKNNKIRCHLCNIGLSDVKCLYRHVLTRHLPQKWGYKCEFCDREFSRDDHLMRHYTTKHKNMEFNREKIRETRRLNREMAKNFHDQISTGDGPSSGYHV